MCFCFDKLFIKKDPIMITIYAQKFKNSKNFTD
jgi:hypothetical protein